MYFYEQRRKKYCLIDQHRMNIETSWLSLDGQIRYGSFCTDCGKWSIR